MPHRRLRSAPAIPPHPSQTQAPTLPPHHPLPHPPPYLPARPPTGACPPALPIVAPQIGAVVANNAASYRYLVESIRMFPDQEAWAGVSRALLLLLLLLWMLFAAAVAAAGAVGVWLWRAPALLGALLLCLHQCRPRQPWIPLHPAASAAAFPLHPPLPSSSHPHPPPLPSPIPPTAETQMIEAAGFRGVDYENLTLGVVAIHSGFKL